MAIQNGFFKSINGDRRYLAEFFTSYFASFIGNGVFPNPSTNLQVINNQNFSTIVRPGKGWINGHYLNNDDNIVINHQPPDGVLRRIDRIVFSVNLDSRSMDIYLKQGTPSTNATAPALIRNSTLYELALADIAFNPGATSISQSNITDQRMNKALCGIVHGVVEQLDTTTLFNQYQQFLIDKGVEFDQQLAVNQQIFDDWFAQLNDILDGDVAANLANMIITHTNNATPQKHIEVVSSIPQNLANKGLLLLLDDLDNPNNPPEVPTSIVLSQRIDDINNKLSRIEKSFNSVNEMINDSSLAIGNVVKLNGYYSAGDKGGHDRLIANTDDGTGIILNNGLYANIINKGKLYSRWFGAKLDGVTNDKAAMNKLFSNFGRADLFVEAGIILTDETLMCEGLWRANSGNNGYRSLTFERATIRYTGEDGLPCLQLFNHHTSKITGVAFERNKVNTYINVASVWYTSFNDCDIPNLAFNRNNSQITRPLQSTASFTNSFNRCYFTRGIDLYGSGAGGLINSITFNNVNFDGRNNTDYNVRFYGTGGFHNIFFNECDLSYVNKANFYIDQNQTTMILGLFGCYLDSNVPIVEGQNYKGATLIEESTRESSLATNQRTIMTTKNALEISRIGTYGVEANNIPSASYNYVRNGDIAFTTFNNSWCFNFSGTGRSIVQNNYTVSGNSINTQYTAVNQGLRFYSVPIPLSGIYTVSIRLKKIQGNGTLEIAYGGQFPKFRIDDFEDGEELLLSYHGNIQRNQGAEVPITLTCNQLRSDTIEIEILEVLLVPGTYAKFGLPLYPSASLAPTTILNRFTTANRPIRVSAGYVGIDNTLNKIIFYDGTQWRDAMGTIV